MDELIHGLMVTVIGMGVTFVALIALSFILDLFRILAEGSSKKENLTQEIEEIEKESYVEESSVEDEDNLELVAAITAVLSASLNTTSDQLVVRSFRRIDRGSSSWKKALY